MLKCRLNGQMILALLCAIVAVGGCNGCKDSNDKTGATGCGGAAPGDKILVGAYDSMTGSEAAFGKPTDDGIRLAVDEINKAGGIKKKQVEVTPPEDTASIQQQGEIAVKHLVEKKVVAVLGEVASGISMA